MAAAGKTHQFFHKCENMDLDEINPAGRQYLTGDRLWVTDYLNHLPSRFFEQFKAEVWHLLRNESRH